MKTRKGKGLHVWDAKDVQDSDCCSWEKVPSLFHHSPSSCPSCLSYNGSCTLLLSPPPCKWSSCIWISVENCYSMVWCSTCLKQLDQYNMIQSFKTLVKWVNKEKKQEGNLPIVAFPPNICRIYAKRREAGRFSFAFIFSFFSIKLNIEEFGKVLAVCKLLWGEKELFLTIRFYTYNNLASSFV